MSSTIFPRALEPAATIAFISPSSRVNDELAPAMARATALLTSKGYKTLQYHVDIICTTDGPSFTELLPGLLADMEVHRIIRANPKIVVGHSDITGLHWFLHAVTGLRTFYGLGAIPEPCESRAADEEKYAASSLAFCVKHLFRAITNCAPMGDIARSPTYAP